MGAVVLDSGFVIQLQKRKKRAMEFVTVATAANTTLKLPSITLLEWCKAEKGAAQLLKLMTIVPINPAIAAAYATVRPLVPDEVSDVDVVVMVTAALAGDPVITTDFADLDTVRSRADLDVYIRTLNDEPKPRKPKRARQTQGRRRSTE